MSDKELTGGGNVVGDLIHIADMLSFRAFERFAEERGYEEWFRGWIQPQWLAWFIALLKECEDDPKLFLHGKWATIQALEGHLAEAARVEVALWQKS